MHAIHIHSCGENGFVDNHPIWVLFLGTIITSSDVRIGWVKEAFFERLERIVTSPTTRSTSCKHIKIDFFSLRKNKMRSKNMIKRKESVLIKLDFHSLGIELGLSISSEGDLMTSLKLGS